MASKASQTTSRQEQDPFWFWMCPYEHGWIKSHKTYFLRKPNQPHQCQSQVFFFGPISKQIFRRPGMGLSSLQAESWRSRRVGGAAVLTYDVWEMQWVMWQRLEAVTGSPPKKTFWFSISFWVTIIGYCIYEQVASYVKVQDWFCFVESLHYILYIITDQLTLLSCLTRSHSEEMLTVAETAMLSIAIASTQMSCLSSLWSLPFLLQFEKRISSYIVCYCFCEPQEPLAARLRQLERRVQVRKTQRQHRFRLWSHASTIAMRRLLILVTFTQALECDVHREVRKNCDDEIQHSDLQLDRTVWGVLSLLFTS
jgi:hypothetical protein